MPCRDYTVMNTRQAISESGRSPRAPRRAIWDRQGEGASAEVSMTFGQGSRGKDSERGMGEPRRERAQQRGDKGRDIAAVAGQTLEEIKRIWKGFVV